MRGVYFEARYRLASRRLAWAQKEVDTAIKTRLLKEAEADIKLEAQLHPALGGDESKKRFDALKETIQQESMKISKVREGMKYKYSEIISGLASGFSNLIFRWPLIGSVFVVAFQSATRVDVADQIITRDQTLFGDRFCVDSGSSFHP